MQSDVKIDCGFLAERAALAAEKMPPEDNSRLMIDSLYQDVKRLYVNGQVIDPVFREVRHRLWIRREQICELLLPERQRSRRKDLLS